MNAKLDAAPVVSVGQVKFGNSLPISIIAGPCALESRAHALEVASALKEIAGRLGIGLVYKSSFDKANRTSGSAGRGIGMAQALPIFAEIRSSLGLPVLTDVHEPAQCAEAARAVDVLQIPAFLCRQTDLLLAAAATGKVVNVKKGQFLAPWEMANVVSKDHRRRQSKCAGDRTRRLVRLQHACLRHAFAADHGADDGGAGDFRRHPFGAAARREGHLIRRPARIRAGAGARGGRRRRRRRVHRDPPRPRFRAVGRAQHGAATRVRSVGEATDGVRRAGQERFAVTASSGMPPVLNIIALATFSAALSARALDPVLPHVAEDFSVSIATAASFAAAFAFTFAIIQPALGAFADIFGKARLMVVCLALLGLANILGAMATSFPLLFASRILAGIGSGGVFPISLSLTSDLVGPEKRQIAMSRTLAGAMTGNLLGATVSGLIGDFLGWRGVLAVLGLIVMVASIVVAVGFRGAALTRPPRTSLSALKQGYRTIFSNPNARICYGAVFIEGCCVLGLFPFIAAFLFELGQTSLSIAGIVIAGFAVGGLFYTLTVSRFLPVIGVNGMMIGGAALVGVQLIAVAMGPEWKLQTLSLIFMGWGFYMIHGSLQVFASELSAEARATALSLHAFFFFMGQTIGPIAYGFGIQHAGKAPTLLTAGAIMIALGFVCAKLLRQTRPADAAAT